MDAMAIARSAVVLSSLDEKCIGAVAQMGKQRTYNVRRSRPRETARVG